LVISKQFVLGFVVGRGRVACLLGKSLNFNYERGEIMKKSVLLLLLALFAVPVWAADAVPASTASEPSAQAAQTAPKHKVKKHKAKKTVAAKNATGSLACSLQQCKGVKGCFQSRCGAACEPSACGAQQ
jgi:hypothetical protein